MRVVPRCRGLAACIAAAPQDGVLALMGGASMTHSGSHWEKIKREGAGGSGGAGIAAAVAAEAVVAVAAAERAKAAERAVAGQGPG